VGEEKNSTSTLSKFQVHYINYTHHAIHQISRTYSFYAGHQWLTPVILATKEAKIRKIMVQGQPGQTVHETTSRKNPSQKKGLVEWLKVKALSSNTSTHTQKNVFLFIL
jgi:hypothetical protein